MTRYHGRHRKATTTGRTVAKVAVTGLVVGAPLTAFAAPASAATAAQWDTVAQCESGGNYATNTGNGFYGGLQFTLSTWAAYGGSGAPQNASKSQQIQVAERVLAGQGKGAWPVCGTGLGAPNTTPVQAQTTAVPAMQSTPAVQSTPEAAAPKAVTRSVPKAVAPEAADSEVVAPGRGSSVAGGYVVKSGDTLAKIATAQGVTGGYQAIFALNQAVIENVNQIYPGQTLRLR